MTKKNVTLKEMLQILRENEIGVLSAKPAARDNNVYTIKFANGFTGYFNENDHINRCIRSLKLDKRNKQAKEIIEKAAEYYPKILVRF